MLNRRRDLLTLVFFALFLFSIPLAVLAQVPEPGGGLTPEKLVSAFDAWAMVIMSVVGFVYTRWPAIRDWTNDAVPWVNAIGYILVSLFAPTVAHAGFLDNLSAIGGPVWVAVKAAGLSALTSILYDKYAKAVLDRIVPKPSPSPGVFSHGKD